MRFASSLFVGVALLLVASVAFTSLRCRGAAAPAHAGALVFQGNGPELRRLEAKTAVTQRLLDGELTLWEAAAWFRGVNRATGAPACVGLPGEEDKSEAERLCRQVIRWAAAEAPADFVRRLEADLDERLCRDGDVALPDAP